MKALEEAQSYLEKQPTGSEHEQVEMISSEIIEGRLTMVELEKVGDSFSNSKLKARAWFRLGQISLDLKDQSSARKYFAKTVNQDPNSNLGKRANELLSQLEAAQRVEPKTIGVVLPLTGKFSSVSQKTLRGIQMGLGLYSENISSFKLAVVDSEANPDTARRGIEKLVKEDNVISIIGSVLSKTASGVASKSSELGVPSIALSQKAGITESGPQVFRNSLTSEMQIRFLVKTAMENFGIRKFAVLYPNDQYGVEFSNIFWDEVLARGGTISSIQSYSSKETDFGLVVQRLVGTFYLEDRAEEYKVRLKDWFSAQKKKTARTTPPEDLLPPVVDFDAIFIPDNAKSMGQIAAMLSFNGVKNVRLLGTNLWNVPGLHKRAGNFSKDLIFVDSFVSSDVTYQNSAFVKEYKTIFQEEPGAFEIQGYDSALILRQLITSGNTSRESLSSALSKLQDFPGSIGNLSMTPEHEVLRPLVALTLEGSDIVPLRKK